MKDFLWTTSAVLFFATTIIAWADSDRSSQPESVAFAEVEIQMLGEPIEPLPAAPLIESAVRNLGERLFHERRLSGDGTQSCASCHDLAISGADGTRLGRARDGSSLGINVPTVFNSSLNFRQFWDGRVATLEEQVDGPLMNPSEMGSSWERVLEALTEDPSYLADFDAAYGKPPSRELVRQAIASFEQTLLTPNARFDRYLRGDRDAISAEELRGFELFKDYGCVACHQGAGVGGNMFQRLGIVRDYFADRGEPTRADLGRYNVTGEESDRHVFKVPSLRNVALTAPYFHDGSAVTVEEAIRVMARYQLGREIPERDIARIALFLGTLTGEIDSSS